MTRPDIPVLAFKAASSITARETDRQTDRQTDRDRQRQRQTDRQTDRQVDLTGSEFLKMSFLPEVDIAHAQLLDSLIGFLFPVGQVA